MDIIEAYTNWEPPPRIRESVKNLINAVPETYKAGLHTVVLANASGLTRRRKRQRARSERGTFLVNETRGLYHGRSSSQPAWIEIFVDNVLDGLPLFLLRAPIILDVLLLRTLYHEIGHHIESTQAPVHRGKEATADEWMRRLGGSYFRQRYWYLRPFRPLLPGCLWLIRSMSRLGRAD